MRTWMYHRLFPEGKIFDTEPNRPDPLIPPESEGWVDEPQKLNMTKDAVIKAMVMQELGKQGSDRSSLEAEYEKKFGKKPHGRMTNETIIKHLDDK